MNSFYQMFNDPYIQKQARQAQQVQREHLEQVENIMKSAHKLKDFLDSLDDIKPEYREEASRTLCAVLFDFMRKHN